MSHATISLWVIVYRIFEFMLLIWTRVFFFLCWLVIKRRLWGSERTPDTKNDTRSVFTPPRFSSHSLLTSCIASWDFKSSSCFSVHSEFLVNMTSNGNRVLRKGALVHFIFIYAKPECFENFLLGDPTVTALAGAKTTIRTRTGIKWPPGRSIYFLNK